MIRTIKTLIMSGFLYTTPISFNTLVYLCLTESVIFGFTSRFPTTINAIKPPIKIYIKDIHNVPLKPINGIVKLGK